MAGLTDCLQIALCISGQINCMNGVAGYHHSSNQCLVELEQIVEHIRLVLVDHAMLPGSGDQSPYLLPAKYLCVGCLIDPKMAEN